MKSFAGTQNIHNFCFHIVIHHKNKYQYILTSQHEYDNSDSQLISVLCRRADLISTIKLQLMFVRLLQKRLSCSSSSVSLSGLDYILRLVRYSFYTSGVDSKLKEKIIVAHFLSETHFGLQVITIFIMAQYNDYVLNQVIVWSIKDAQKKCSFQFPSVQCDVLTHSGWMLRFIDDSSKYSTTKIAAD